MRLVGVDEVGLGQGVSDDPTIFRVDRGLRATDDEAQAIEIEIGSAVVTAAESRYPADIPVGIVRSVETDEGGLIQIVIIELAADVRDLGFVSIVVERIEDRPPIADTNPVTASTVPGLSSDIDTGSDESESESQSDTSTDPADGDDSGGDP